MRSGLTNWLHSRALLVVGGASPGISSKSLILGAPLRTKPLLASIHFPIEL
jgi:hypothetical protein